MTAYTCLDLSAAGDVPPDGILSRTLFSDERVKVVWFGFGAGQELSEHTAAVPAILHILSGEAQLQLGPDTQAARAGTWVHMPAGLPHGVRAITALRMVLILLQDAR